MKYVLTCDCDSVLFTYDIDRELFVCLNCGEEYPEENAGSHLVGEEL